MKLGVLGGTFDPIHIGHLLMAEQARDQLELDVVWLVPASRPPHKPDHPMSRFEHRVAMAELAAAADEALTVSELERDTRRPSYTVETLRNIHQQCPELESLWLILGEDSLRDLSGWRDPREILSLARVAALPRPTPAPAHLVPTQTTGVTNPPLTESPLEFEWTPIEGARIEISATLIRQRVRESRSIRYLVPDSVRHYIHRHRLYLESADPFPQNDGTADG